MQKPMIHGVEVKVGQKWKTRSGKTIIEVMSVTGGGNYPVRDYYGSSWDLAGYYGDGDPDDFDLVELVQDIEQPKAKARVVEETINGVTKYIMEVLQEDGHYDLQSFSDDPSVLIKQAELYSTVKRKVIHEVF